VADSIQPLLAPPRNGGGFGKAAGRIVGKGLWGVVASVPGVVDEKNGTVLFYAEPALDGGAVLPGLIGQIWKAPVALVQEERALALGHQRRLRRRGFSFG